MLWPDFQSSPVQTGERLLKHGQSIFWTVKLGQNLLQQQLNVEDNAALGPHALNLTLCSWAQPSAGAGSLSLQCEFSNNCVGAAVLHLVCCCWGSLCSGLSGSGWPFELVVLTWNIPLALE